MSNQVTGYDLTIPAAEFDLGAAILNPAWADGMLPKTNDVFVGAQLAAQETAVVDVAKWHAHVQQLLHANAALQDANRDLQTRLKENEQLSALKDAKIQEKCDIAAAQTIFLFHHWNQHPLWTAMEAYQALVAYVRETLQHQSLAHSALQTLHKGQKRNNDS